MRRVVLPCALLVAAALAAGCPKPEAGTSPVSTMPSTALAGQNPAPAGEAAAAPTPSKTETGAHHAHDKTASTDREQVDADGVVRRGTPLSPALQATPVSVAVAKARELDGKSVKLTGKVSDVCTKMGCWFVVQGDKPEDKIRISTKAHNIFVPRSAVGMTATVEGTLAVKMLSQKTAQHFEDERELQPGEQRRTITADVPELAIDVVGLEMRTSG